MTKKGKKIDGRHTRREKHLGKLLTLLQQPKGVTVATAAARLAVQPRTIYTLEVVLEARGQRILRFRNGRGERRHCLATVLSGVVANLRSARDD